MSRNNSPKYSRSASEGNLADCEDDEPFQRDSLPVYSKANTSDSKLVSSFSTLPRRMGTRKRFKRKQLKRDEKYERVAEPKVAKNSSKHPELKKIPKSASTDGFFTRLFKSLGSLTNNNRSNINNGQNYKVTPASELTLNVKNVKNTNTNIVSATLPSKPKPTNSKSRLISASNNDIRSQPQPVLEVTTNETHDRFKDKTPAICGLKNHGNTCFMNAVIQCLCNTDSFAEYFVLDQYKVDLSRHNKIHAKKYGTKGEVTEQLAQLLKSVWSCQYLQEISNKFKNLVSKYGNQYEGSLQHDAQEFLLWLLDKVHEDLNIATKKKYKKPKSGHGRQDMDLAAEVLSNYRRCNNSFVQDLFQAQFRSSLTCPGCMKQSNTFDPYLCISLPIPNLQTRPIFVNLILPSQAGFREIKLGIPMDSQCNMKELREKLACQYDVPEQQFILTEISDESGFQQSFSVLDPLSVIQGSQEVTAIQVPLYKPLTGDNNAGEKLIIIWVNQVKTKSQNQVFGPPFVMQILREATYDAIQKKILDHMNCILKNNIPKEDLGVLFKLRVISGCGSTTSYLPHDVDHPLYMPCVDQALGPMDELCGPSHLKIVVEWDEDTKMTLIRESIDDLKDEDAAVKELRDQSQTSMKASLHECFELYFMEEKLGVEDAWMCPNCKRRQQGTKKLSLWTTPDIFIVHLKRFRQQSSSQRTKLMTDVVFPINGLDVSPYVAYKTTPNFNDATTILATSTLTAMSSWSPWRRHRANQFERSEETYDLYAVCNHHGSMQGGHYTAYCKNPVDNKWYLFDDMKVRPAQESEIVTPDAYILFYQRSAINNGSCSSSSTSGYSTSSTASLMVNSEHWAYRMPPFHHWPAKGSQSQDNLCDLDNPSSRTPKLNNRNFERTRREYSSMVTTSSTKRSASSNSHNVSAEAELDRHSDNETSSPSTTINAVPTQYQTLPASIKTRNNNTTTLPLKETNIIALSRKSLTSVTSPPESPPPSPSKIKRENSEDDNNQARIWTITSV